MISDRLPTITRSLRCCAEVIICGFAQLSKRDSLVQLVQSAESFRYTGLTQEPERMFADFGVTPFSKTVPVINGGVEVPQGPGLAADPEDDLIAQFRV